MELEKKRGEKKVIKGKKETKKEKKETKKGKKDSKKEKKASKKEKDTKKVKKEVKKPSLLDRSIMSQEKYMDFLSIPNPKLSEEPEQIKYKQRCELEPCSPRLVQLAVPNKRRVIIIDQILF